MDQRNDFRDLQVHTVFSPICCQQNDLFRTSDSIVVLTFDDNYVDQSANLILSVRKYHPEQVSFICICPRLRPENISALLELPIGIQVRCYGFTAEFSAGRWSTCAVLRLFCPWLLEEQIHRVLYLDSDILCTGSIRNLFEAEVPCIAMASEISGNVSPSRQETFRNDFPTQVYCNSGVVIFNLDYLRSHHSFGEFYTVLSDMLGKYTYLDQDFLNRFFMGKIEYLNPFQYNFQAYELLGTPMYRSALRLCALIHFSVGKPWKFRTRMPLIRLYRKHSLYPAMIRQVNLAAVKRIPYLPIAYARRALSPLRQACRERREKRA